PNEPPKSVAALFIIFFFQAEDGIRDGHVTGVQTCALPICRLRRPPAAEDGDDMAVAAKTRTRERGGPQVHARRAGDDDPARGSRSEERRVGKECRSRWEPDH